MVHSQNAFGKSYGVKTEKSYFCNYEKCIFRPNIFPAKQGWVTFLVFVVSCDPCQESKRKKCFENGDR